MINKLIKQRTILITGVNRGLGLEFIKQYSKNNYQVFGCCRNLKAATELLSLTKRFPYMKLFQADVTNQLDLEAIAEELGETPIDILINNAGTYGNNNETIETFTEESMQATFKTNTLAPLTLIKFLLKNILSGQEKKIVNISSNMASISNNTTGGAYAYRASKAALNAVMKSIAIDLQKVGIKILLMHPGWIKTDIGTDEGILTQQESVESMIKIINSYAGKEIAPFLDCNGKIIPW